MGYLARGQCFSTASDAADAHFSGQGPSYTAGDTSYQSWFEKVSGVWMIKRQSISSAGAVTNLTSSAVTVPSFPMCDELMQFNDGILVGWGIATVMVAAWGFSKIRQQAR